jgi:hypothetical protein
MIEIPKLQNMVNDLNVILDKESDTPKRLQAKAIIVLRIRQTTIKPIKPEEISITYKSDLDYINSAIKQLHEYINIEISAKYIAKRKKWRQTAGFFILEKEIASNTITYISKLLS